MDTFIVRIYRRAATGAQDAAGTIEHVESGERVGFTDTTELLARLLGTSVASERGKESNAPPGAHGNQSP